MVRNGEPFFQNTLGLDRKYLHATALLVERVQEFIYREFLVKTGRLGGRPKLNKRLTGRTRYELGDRDKELKSTSFFFTVLGELTGLHCVNKCKKEIQTNVSSSAEAIQL